MVNITYMELLIETVLLWLDRVSENGFFFCKWQTRPHVAKYDVAGPYLLQCGYTPFLVACEYKRLEMVEYLMNLPGVDVGACCHSNKEGKGATGLHLAAYQDAEGVAELLITANHCHFDAVDKYVSPVAPVPVPVAWQ